MVRIAVWIVMRLTPKEAGQLVARRRLPTGTRFHDLRHFYASALIDDNLNPKIIQARIGQATPAEAMDTYGHQFPDTQDLGRTAVDQALGTLMTGPGRLMTMKLPVRRRAAGESACRPGSVHPHARADGHPSRTAVTGSLVRSTREHRAGRPRTLAQEPRPDGRGSLLTLLRVGFTEPLRSP